MEPAQADVRDHKRPFQDRVERRFVDDLLIYLDYNIREASGSEMRENS